MGDVVHSADDLRFVGRQFDRPQHTAAQMRAFVVDELGKLGAPWGDNGVGQQFGTKFVESMSDLTRLLGDMSGGLSEIGSDFGRMAAKVEYVEEHQSK
jgi:hypothetical protein